MGSQHLSRRHLSLIQASLAILAVLAVLGFSGSFAAQRGRPVLSANSVGDLRLNVNVSALAADSTQAYLKGAAQRIPSPAEAFDALNSRVGGGLVATWDTATGIPRFLTGNNGSIRIPYTPTEAERGNALAVALGFLDENRALFRLNSAGNDFGPGRMEADKQLGFSNIRLPQMYKGVPVYGRELVVHLDRQQQIVAVSGQYAPGLNIPSQATIARDEAEKVALDDLRQNELTPAESSGMQAAVLKGKTALNVYVDENGKATLTWNVQIATTSPLGEWTIFVNARRPVVVHAIDGLNEAKYRKTYSAGNGTDIPGRLLADEGERTSDVIGQAAHDAAGKVYDYYFSTFKRDSIDDQGMPMVSTVHYGTDPTDAENAAWVGDAQQMIYGDGGTDFKPLAYGLDIVGHEFTHGITDSTAQLIYEGQSGALNESYSDVFGAMIDRANWTIGEAVIKSPPYPVPYLRSLQDPTIGNKYDASDPLNSVGQPANMSQYANLPLSRRADYGGVHINSGIPNRAAYLLTQAIGREKTEQIYYRTLTQYLSPDSNFSDAATASAQAATDLYGASETAAVRSAFSQVGINASGTGTGPIPPSTGTPSPAPSTPIPSETLPTGCSDIIVNGGFEGSGGWREISSTNTGIIDPELPHTGSQSAWLGGTDKETVQYIYQDITLPPNATSVRLSYYRLLHEEFSGILGLLAGDATFSVLLADTNGNQIAGIEDLSSSQADDTWKQAQFDLSRYAGQTIRLVISSSNPRGNISSLFVDDVSLVACTTGQAPTAPSTSSADQVYIAGHILDSDTGRGISGAQIFILKQGTSASDAAADGQVTDDEVLTYGTADNNGYYQTQDPITRNQTYSVIVIADGYNPILADDGLSVPSDATNPTRADATMRAGR